MIDISHMSRRPVTMVEEDIVTRVRNCSDSFNVISSKPERVYKDVGGYFDIKVIIWINWFKDECVLRKLQSPFPFPGLDIASSLTRAAAEILCR